MISLFDFDDYEMLECKYGNWWELNEQRGRANNSAVLERGKIENLRKDLALTDWYVVRCAETGKPIPEEVLAERQEKRDRINELQEQIRRSLCQ